MAVVLTLVQAKQIRINIHKQNTVQTIQNTVNTGTRITETIRRPWPASGRGATKEKPGGT